MKTPRIRILRIDATIDLGELGKKRGTASLRRTHVVFGCAARIRAEAEAEEAAMAAEAEETELAPEKNG